MPADLKPFRDSVVRITDDDSKFFGVGYLVAPNIVITCAHVVSDALGLEPEEYPEGSVLLNRPLAEDEIEKNQYVCGHVTANGWFPKNSDGKGVLVDLAVLELDTPLIQAKGMCASLATSLELSKNIDFVAYGGSLGHRDNLIDIKGVVGDILGNGFYHLNVSASDYKIEEGCSGAPACDIATGEVIGLIAQREMDPEIDAGFLIPNSQLRQALLIAAPYTLGAGASGKRLSKLREWARKQIQPHDRSLSQSVQRFIGNYSGTLENPIPFAGRDQELRELDHWLNKGGGSFRLLSGAAGLGKSALVLHWIESLLEQCSERHIVFAPISIRFETSEELRGLKLLHFWLTSLFPDLRFPPEAKPDQNDYREKILHAWQLMENRPKEIFLLVIDGADEAARGWILKDVLCYEMPANLNILLTARHKPGNEDGRYWLDDFKFGPGTKVCEPIELLPLSRNAVGEAVVQLGYPLDDFVERDGILEELYRLTDKGDPLLVTLWVGQLWQDRNRASQFKADELRILQPSFKGFLEIWRKEQEKLWQNSNPDVDWRDFEWGLYVLSLACGPLLMDELYKVIKQLEPEAQWDYRPMRSAFKNAIRLVAGNGEDQGFVFVHPRLAYHFQEQLQQQGMRFSRIQQAYLKWGADVVRQLNDGKQWCSSYLLQHYTDHIKDAHLPAEEALDNYYLPLLDSGWHQAWHEQEGAYGGFLRDLNRINAALQDFNHAMSNRGLIGSLRIVEELACSLIHASIISSTGKIPPVLIVNMVKADLWTSKRALALAEQHFLDSTSRSECFLGLSYLSAGIERKNALQQALGAATEISEEKYRAKALAAVAAQLRGDERQNALRKALKTATRISNEYYRAEALVDIAKHLQGEPKLLRQALKTATGISNEYYRAEALIAIAKHLQGEPKLLRQVLEAATRISEEKYRAEALIAVADHLKGKERQNVLCQALETATRISDEWDLSDALVAIAKHLQGEPKLLRQVLKSATEISDEWSRAKAMAEVAGHLKGKERKSVLRQALEAAAGISDKGCLATTLAAVAGQFKGKERRSMLRQALEAIRFSDDEESQAICLVAIAKHLKGEPELLRQALEVAAGIELLLDEELHIEALAAVAGQLLGEPELIRKAIEVTIGNYYIKESRVKILAVIASPLKGKEYQNALRQVLEASTRISDEKYRAETLIAVADHLKGKERQNVLCQALEAATRISDEYYLSGALVDIAKHLKGEPELLRQVLKSATEISDEWSRARALTDIASHLKGKERQNVLCQALEAATRISDELSFYYNVDAIVSHLQGEPKLLRQVLEAAIRISNEKYRATALIAIASHLKGKERQNVLCQALEAATRISNEWDRATALTDIAKHLKGEPELLRQVLKSATEISNEKYRAKALIAVADHLKGKERQNVLCQALGAANRISDEKSRAEALTDIADHLQGEERKSVLRQALGAANRISDEEHRASALDTALLNWSQPADYDQYRNWLKVAGTLGRDHFLAIIKTIIPTIEALGGQKAIVRTAKAIEETALWWP